MSTQHCTRVLFLDDSGKPSAADASKAVVIGGFSIPAQNVITLDRRTAGAKARFYPNRGNPGTWELKSHRTINPNPWNRAKNRNFVYEMLRILGSLDASVYSATIDKRRLHHPMTLNTTMPLQLQALVEHFAVECQQHRETGWIVSDWSYHSLDAHASECVRTFVITRSLPVHPSIYYANSRASHAIQVADLIAGIRRRSAEGDKNLQQTDADLAAIRTLPQAAPTTHKGHAYTNRIQLI
ncbi:MAG: DUF3800 domain-containing protein [Acidimicrobiaceae bacterium]|nr:DUF3800 domain-containing protein [Acidimicrobiaceae bacterium]MCY4280469.1 DUF3800 domain-containing protein [Acidimicrobiaceae bacterium]